MTAYKFRINGKEYNVTVGRSEGKSLKVNVNGADYDVEVEGALQTPAPTAAAVQAAPAAMEKPVPAPAAAPAPSTSQTSVVSPMQGNVVEICANVGDNVAAGQKIVVIESMKMEVEISAPRAGKLTAILVAKGDHLEENQSVASLA